MISMFIMHLVAQFMQYMFFLKGTFMLMDHLTRTKSIITKRISCKTHGRRAEIKQ